MEKIRGLLKLKPEVGWGLLLATIAIAGIPPFAIFNSEFMIIMATVHNYLWLALIIVIGIVVALAGLFRHLQLMVYGEPTSTPDTYQAECNMWPVFCHIAIILILGLYTPSFLVTCLTEAAKLIS
jgi:hydrogenase-4 component F